MPRLSEAPWTPARFRRSAPAALGIRVLLVLLFREKLAVLALFDPAVVEAFVESLDTQGPAAAVDSQPAKTEKIPT